MKSDKKKEKSGPQELMLIIWNTISSKLIILRRAPGRALHHIRGAGNRPKHKWFQRGSTTSLIMYSNNSHHLSFHRCNGQPVSHCRCTKPLQGGMRFTPLAKRYRLIERFVGKKAFSEMLNHRFAHWRCYCHEMRHL